MAAAAAEAEVDSCLQSFELYEAESKFYILGTNSNKTIWRLLKIDRMEPSELNVDEDSTVHSQSDYLDMLKNLDEEHRSTGGVKFVTNCFGIIGFIKFLGPYYMLIITEQRKIGDIFGHPVYQVTKTAMIELSNSKSRPKLINSKDENRYKKLLQIIDLRKDFFFSHSYHIMRSLQKNFNDPQEGWELYDTMFVWNEFLTRGVRDILKTTLWTVALVYGFFKQDKFAICGKDIMLTLIARRSRHYAGTRYLKRGVNEEGRVANDVETEQIVYENMLGPWQISSVVQNRGSIPLFWSQETSKLNLKPDIILHEKDKNYEATRLHFENLRKRYGNPIIILNLIKTLEKRPREIILRWEFDRAIKIINSGLPGEDHLRFLHWDLHKNSQSKSTNALQVLLKVAFEALNMTEFFYCQVSPDQRAKGSPNLSPTLKIGFGHHACDDKNCGNADYVDDLDDISQEDTCGSSDPGNGIAEDKFEVNGSAQIKRPKFQKGVLRTNCIDCLDRTNVAQYAYGLAALGHQLHALGSVESPEVHLDSPLSRHLMHFYERMGDTLALQYGGSAAHNKIFSAKRGHLKFAIQSQEFFRTLQRYYSNAYMDAYKQAAINLFLGYFQPQVGKPALWEPESGDEHVLDDETCKLMKRARSDGSILNKSKLSISSNGPNGILKLAFTGSKNEGQRPNRSSDTACDNGMSKSRYTPTLSHIKHISCELDYYNGSGDSNFLDLDWLTASDNERSKAISTPDVNISTDSGVRDVISGTTDDQASGIHAQGFSKDFVQWLNQGEAFWY
ncbi:phosphoinositide phosphatase SAC2 isoform X1 [Zea mays]|uniref:Phosphoinositide phosphatase SAC2 n=2 Tax=Zea mays TaxID=4577 RepID=A0A1D6NT30_MAIZE|nr:phosphoinositide phosphatase SAC2 isoform X1 [Zea mays]AQL01369.1 Phosphoinositide phosphatase SAC2 [Zea mays]AQL01383.1 Phosphoinositide phosphatase SAC2 [Zea mays]|eukprot:XP_020399997.1 phosphoinositide phosphatase SAC2 isoform X1 [Zea mays]